MQLILSLQQGARLSQPPAKIGSLILLDGAGVAGHVTVSSFGDPDPEGRWTLGPCAKITSHLHLDAARYVVKMRCRPFRSDGHVAQVHFRINDGPLHQLRFSWRFWSNFAFPIPDNLSLQSQLKLEWHISNPRSPAASGHSDDPRPLGMMLARLEVREKLPDWFSRFSLSRLFRGLSSR